MSETQTANESIEIAVQHNPGIVLLDRKQYEAFYSHVAAEVAAHVPDLTTDGGRKAIAALAYKVSRTKTAIDDAGAGLKSEWLKKSQAVDASRREIREAFDALRDKARKPLTDWEAAEEAREKADAATLSHLVNAAVILENDTVAVLLKRLEDVTALDVPTHLVSRKVETTVAIKSGIMRADQAEKDRTELARLRAEAEAREQAERARIINETAEKNRAIAAEAVRIAEEKRIADEKARIEKAAIEAETKARRETEDAARQAAAKIEAERKAESDRIAAAHAAELAKERKAAADAQAKQQAETLRVAREEAARQAIADREKAEAAAKAKEAAKLAANKAHRERVTGAAHSAILKCDPTITSEQAENILHAISNGEIPAVELRFS